MRTEMRSTVRLLLLLLLAAAAAILLLCIAAVTMLNDGSYLPSPQEVVSAGWASSAERGPRNVRSLTNVNQDDVSDDVMLAAADDIMAGYRDADWPADKYRGAAPAVLRAVCAAVTGDDRAYTLADCLHVYHDENTWTSSLDDTRSAVAAAMRRHLQAASDTSVVPTSAACPADGETVHSVGYPHNYADDVVCSTLVAADDDDDSGGGGGGGGGFVLLDFTAFSLDSNAAFCSPQYDHVSITRFWRRVRLYTELYCGDGAPSRRPFDADSVLLEFHTNEVGADSGFSASVVRYNDPADLHDVTSVAASSSGVTSAAVSGGTFLASSEKQSGDDAVLVSTPVLLTGQDGGIEDNSSSSSSSIIQKLHKN
ncbi:PREDICTED: uncharacterized protein LOC106816547 [Priapulus caudatus]|uniref:Uncharacterized protein LOC106816547 n=1 Tax=Priapulus caudatus TaxID=37621 RepID=A0ABM1EWT6_PRICU|nr:PREDICTED: uncharacterized protein LOC106816547 [Priapulus caudatus]